MRTENQEKKSCGCGTSKSGSACSTGGCSGACSSGGCNKMNVFDWLSDMDLSVNEKFDVMEVRFKNGRKDFYRNSDKHTLLTGDAVVVEAPGGGHHVGHISLQGELVRLQMRKLGMENNDEIKKVFRMATQSDLEKFKEATHREMTALYRTREIIQQFKLQMKLSDVEFQGDNSKAIFYYSADDRVDFRALIKVLASEFRVRIEMRQINLRQEAGRLGGIGVCGRELCCSTWLTNFKNVSTSAARYQNLSLNPMKLSGQCGRLKCCLNYELETYIEALKDIPEVEVPLRTAKGDAVLQKTDIFRKIMWFSFAKEDIWHPLSTIRVSEILAMNKSGKTPATLELNELVEAPPTAVLNSDLDRMDKKFQQKKKKNKNRNKHRQPFPKKGNTNNPS